MMETKTITTSVDAEKFTDSDNGAKYEVTVRVLSTNTNCVQIQIGNQLCTVLDWVNAMGFAEMIERAADVARENDSNNE